MGKFLVLLASTNILLKKTTIYKLIEFCLLVLTLSISHTFALRNELFRRQRHAGKKWLHSSHEICNISFSSSALFLAKETSTEEPMRCKHKQLRQIFNKDDEYIFQITKNIRSYEWTEEEVETLFTDFLDSMDLQNLRKHKKDERTKYELNQMIVLQNADGNYEVIDGQQRLVTLCLLYAAIRDVAPDNDHGKMLKDDVQKRLVVLEYDEDPIPRVTLRRKENTYFQNILDGVSLEFPPLKELNSIPEQRIIQNYKKLADLIKSQDDVTKGKNMKQSIEFIKRLYKFLNENVYIYLTIPENQVVARKLIMGSRKGKDTEPIDELKGLVVFNIDDEATQDLYLDRWASMIEELGRDLCNDACLFMAQAELSLRLKKNEEYEILEEFWRSHGVKVGGAEFFDTVLVPGIKSLERLRLGIDRTSDTLESVRFSFICDVAMAKAATKEIEIVALHALRYREKNGGKYFSHCAPILERVALLFLITDVPKRMRSQRIFGMINSITFREPLHDFDLTRTEKKQILHSLHTTNWGATPGKMKAIRAILVRINVTEMLRRSESHLSGLAFTVEHILPQTPNMESRWMTDWKESDRKKWVHRLGNLCLLNRRNNSAAKNLDFSDKVHIYKKVPYPLTLSVANDFEKWTLEEMLRQHKYLYYLVLSHFSLKL